MLLRVCALVALLAVSASASASESFRNTGRKPSPTAEHTVTLFAPLKASAAAQCDSALMDVSMPDSPNYGKHWEFSRLSAFSDFRKFSQLAAWVRARGFKNVFAAPNKEYVTITAPVAELEAALDGVTFFEFEVTARTNPITIIAAEMPRGLPSVLRGLVEIHTGLDRLPTVHSTSPVLGRAQASGVATPRVIFDTYKINDRTIKSTKANNALFGALGQSFNPTDLAAFQTHYGIPNTKISHVVGPNSPSSCSANPNNCAEASLDVQQITSIAQGTNTTFWAVPQSVSDIFVYWIEQVAATSNPPLVHSISYGSIATEDPKNDMKRFNTEICKMGLRGLTVMVASGDDGVANFIARGDKSKCGFTPSYPATSPYVTAVGATQGPESSQPEVACTSKTGGLITSGGGFSDFFKMPSYQESAVHAYIAKGSAVDLPPTNQFNTAGRAYPDVSSMGHNFPIELSGNLYEGSGTSASCPDFAGMVTLVNGLRLAAGKSSLGFLNPAIYSKLLGTSAFNDITSGRNNCAAGSPTGATCCQYGFNATQGWDPITGAGTVHFPSFSSSLLSM
jgi:tripeptidyl-peptidase I